MHLFSSFIQAVDQVNEAYAHYEEKISANEREKANAEEVEEEPANDIEENKITMEIENTLEVDQSQQDDTTVESDEDMN